MASFASGSIHVIGGGLGGSALATCMAEDGFEVTLYDEAEPFESRWTRVCTLRPKAKMLPSQKYSMTRKGWLKVSSRNTRKFRES